MEVTPANGLLFSFDDFFQEYCAGTRLRCYDQSEPGAVNDETWSYNLVTVTGKTNPSVKEVRFSKAVFKYPTHKIGYATIFRRLRGHGADVHQSDYFDHDI
jgi:hypothetical protein